ncbi:MAG: hydroxymethylpyrimidine/phosphomethylpyrimidine kinase [Pseudomonadales bacterium]|nr:hydroxymethylpyrimidine/phosphomethylpyrimidine kinase [Pseudomonadales bacterium]
MSKNNATPPAVLTFSGLDPSGGAGSQADIETLISLGCHCCPVVTAITSQDTCNIKNFNPTASTVVIEQARAVLEDIQIAAFKIGMLGSVDNVEAIHSILMDYPDIPVVFDPVIAAGGGGNLSSDAIIEASISLLLPQTTLITPNSLEAREYSPGADSLEACAHELMELGAEHVLITGSHERTDSIQNRLWGNQRFIADFTWERLPGQFHGSGCTLAAATAGLLAHGVDMVTATRNAQAYTFNTLKNARRLGMGQLIPYRMFWADADHNKGKTEAVQTGE